MSLCPKCGVREGRPQVYRGTPTHCEPCLRAANVARHARRSRPERVQRQAERQQRAAEAAALGRTLCPRCGVRPSRLRVVYRGRVSYCEPCVREAKRARDTSRRALEYRAYPDDLPAHEIDRLFEAALREIRARR